MNLLKRVKRLFKPYRLPHEVKGCFLTDWDYGYLLELEKYKLTRMVCYFKRNPYTEGVEVEKAIAEMRLCCKLIDIINKVNCDDYGIIKNKIYCNPRNAKRFCPKLVKFSAYEVRPAKALYLYNKIRTYRMLTWWI
jgi:hypothetical protein